MSEELSKEAKRGARRPDEQQQWRINESAQQFAGALKGSYRAVSDRGVSTQELNAEQTEQFFNSVFDNLQTQAEANRQLTEQLADQAQRGQEASRQLTRESVQAYMDFVNSASSFSQAGLGAAQRAQQRST